MSAAVQRFQSEFLKSPSQKRAALIQKVVALNQQNTGILNLLANVDMNYRPNTNLLQEEFAKRRADNIYFICKMLISFPDFRYE
jgi:hypothetical protein